MPNVLPTIPNDPPQGIQALLDKVYLWNPDVSNELIEKINALLTKLGDAIGAIRPYNELVAPINQYEPCYYGDGVYVAKNYLAERAEEFNEEDWILIARKGITAEDLTAGNVSITFAGQEDTLQNAIDTLKTDQDELGDQVSAIESKIPADASETNQLVTNVDLSGYLPLSGGMLTGPLKFEGGSGKNLIEFHYENYAPVTIQRYNSDTLEISYAGTNPLYFFAASYLYPGKDNYTTLGLSGRKWKTVYTNAINNGANIAVPTTGGTLALAEDIAESVTTKELTVGTEEGTLNIGITAGVATIATNNGLDIVSQTKFDTAPTTDDTTAWADVNATALVTKAQVTTALSTAGGGTSVTIRNWA